MSGPVDVRGILERAGADAAAPEGSQAWALAQVEAAVAELISAATAAERAIVPFGNAKAPAERLHAALARIAGGRA